MSDKKYTSVYLNGFRATGKTTIGKAVALKLGWDFIDLDKEIQQFFKVTINELTKGGSDWSKFRAMEQELLKRIINKKNIVVAMGGGTTVNNIQANKNETFGEQNWKILQSAAGALVILLTADEKIIAGRMRAHEMRAPQVSRPKLSPAATAAHPAAHPAAHANHVEEIIQDSLKNLRIRKDLYLKQTENTIDTSKTTKQKAVAKILALI